MPVHFEQKAILHHYPLRSRFPDHTRGFFYYHHQSHMPTLASSIRFRCTSSPDPAEFNHGKDLLTEQGLPWNVSMPYIMRATRPLLRDYLLHSGFITQEQIAQWQHVLKKNDPGRSQVIYRLDQPFMIRFNRMSTILTTFVGDFFGTICLRYHFVDYRKIAKGPSQPYHGSLTLCSWLNVLSSYRPCRLGVGPF
jgi:hypothetical protein